MENENGWRFDEDKVARVCLQEAKKRWIPMRISKLGWPPEVNHEFFMNIGYCFEEESEEVMVTIEKRHILDISQEMIYKASFKFWEMMRKCINFCVFFLLYIYLKINR